MDNGLLPLNLSSFNLEDYELFMSTFNSTATGVTMKSCSLSDELDNVSNDINPVGRAAVVERLNDDRASFFRPPRAPGWLSSCLHRRSSSYRARRSGLASSS